MGFGKEMEEFVSSFRVGAALVGDKRKQKAAEEEALRADETARSKLKQQNDQYDRTFQLNERKLNESQRQHGDRIKMTQAQIDAQNARTAAALEVRKSEGAANRGSREKTAALSIDERAAGREDANSRFEMTRKAEQEKAAAARKKDIAENPLLDDEANAAAEAEANARWPEQALPVDVNPADRPGVPGAYPHVAPVLDAGLKYLQENVVNGSAVGGAQVFASGQGARTPEELALLSKLVDPFNELDDRMRSIVVMTDSYERLVKAGKPEEAAAMAASIIQSARVAAAVHGGAALAKMEDGDTDGAIEQLEKGMNTAPDGRSVVLDKDTMTFQYVDDQSGKVVAEGEITPENIVALATGLKDGSAFWSAIMQAAKGDDAAAKSVGADEATLKAGRAKGTKSDEYFDGKAVTVDAEAYAEAEGEFMPDEAGETKISLAMKDLIKDPDNQPIAQLVASSAEEIAGYMGEENYTALQELATYIKVHNNVSGEQAAAIALELSAPLDDPEQWNFKMPRRAETTGWAELRTSSGRSIVVPESRAMPALVKARSGLAVMQDELEQVAIGERRSAKQRDETMRDPPMPINPADRATGAQPFVAPDYTGM